MIDTTALATRDLDRSAVVSREAGIRVDDTSGNDTLTGSSGDDHIFITTGHDTVDGGDGFDTLTLLNNQKVLSSKNLSVTGVEDLRLNGNFTISDFDLSQFEVISELTTVGYSVLHFSKQATVQGVEFRVPHVVLEGSVEADLFDLSLSHNPISLDGNDGNDTLVGGANSDWLNGGRGDDLIRGGDGSDTITEKGDSNTIYGDGGRDIIQVNGERDQVYGGDGNDTLSLRSDVFSADGGAGDDIFNIYIGRTSQTSEADGGDGDDHFAIRRKRHSEVQTTLHGGAGNDFLVIIGKQDLSGVRFDGIETLTLVDARLTIGAETLGSFENIDCKELAKRNVHSLRIELTSGGEFTWSFLGHQMKEGRVNGSSEDDKMSFGDTRTHWKVHGAGGDDSISGGAGDSFLGGGDGNDTLIGHGKFDTLFGDSGNDTLIGNGQKDYLRGKTGDDVLVAGAGLDSMYGGAGHDRFVFQDGVGGTIIYDFTDSGADKDVIDLSKVSTVKNFQDLVAHHTQMIDHDQVLLITYGTSEIALVHLKTSDLRADDFHF